MMTELKKPLALGLYFVLISCQSPETKLHEEREVKSKATREAVSKKVVFLDARPPFIVATEVIPQALAVDWHDFTTHQPPNENTLVNDLYFHARRLARMGIALDTPVVVLGRGLRGEGEEGRLAWTLRYLGLQNVKFSSEDQFRFSAQSNPLPEPIAVPIWKPQLRDHLLLNVSGAKRELAKGAQLIEVEGKMARPPPGTPSHQMKNHPTLSWPEIYLLSLEKRKEIFSQKLGLPKGVIIVADQDGVKAATVTLWLHEAGYDARCLCEGGGATLINP